MHYVKNLLSLIKISEYYSPYALNNITWCCAIGTPNIFLSEEYFVASSRALCARPAAPAATCRHHQQNANGNHHGFYHVTGTPWAMQSLRSWRFRVTRILCKSISLHMHVRMNECLCFWQKMKVKEQTKIHCKHRKLMFTTTFHFYLENFIVCLMEQYVQGRIYISWVLHNPGSACILIFLFRQNINADSIKCKISRRNWQIKNAVMWSHYAYRGGDKKQKLHWKITIVRQEYTTGNGMGKDDCCGRQWRHKGNKTDSFDW
jgi:hypothetical protein